MNAVDWALGNYPVEVKTIGIMGYAGDYGGDYAKGVKAAAEANGLTVAWEYIVQSPEFDVAQAVGLMVTKPVDAYFPAVGPTHMAQVAGGAFQQGLLESTHADTLLRGHKRRFDRRNGDDLWLGGQTPRSRWCDFSRHA